MYPARCMFLRLIVQYFNPGYPQGYNENAAIKRGYLPGQVQELEYHMYSRVTHETRDRLETVLGSLESCQAITYSSGLASLFALLHAIQPATLLTSRKGYHGSHMTIDSFIKGRETKVLYLEDGASFQELKRGDLIWLESPLNPFGDVVDFSTFINRPKGVYLAVDATFAPPPLQYCLDFGVDVAMHSSTKFLGGHSDLLGGVLLSRDPALHSKLVSDRIVLGSVMGNLEAYLLLRSLRTLKVRVTQQSHNASQLAAWLSSQSEPCLDSVKKVFHASLPLHPGHEAAKKQGKGWSGVLSISFATPHHARLICTNLSLFDNATSLGGCESLIEWRAAVDETIDPTICRLNIGLEEVEDLQQDLRKGLIKVDELVKALSL